jgi:predicted  nucleic acid-binding Zn-ribbon protein
MMRKLYLILCLTIFVPLISLKAQKPIRVITDSIQFGNYLYPGFNVTIPEAEYDKTLKSWIKEQEKGTKSKVMTENGEMTIFGAIVKEISPSPINIYSRLMNEDTLSRLLVCIELKKDQYVDPAVGDIQLTAARNYLKEFAKSQYIEYIKGELATEEKKLRDLNKDLGGLENSKAHSQKTARNKRNTVNDEQEKLLIKNNELSVLSNEIIVKNNEMFSMPVGPGRDAMESQIKELEKRRKGLQKEIGKSENRIRRAKSDIDQADRSIPRNEDEQSVMKARIADQQAVVQQFVDKLNTVKRY